MKRIFSHIALTLFVLQLLTMLVSWLLSAVYPVSGIHSLLSGEGLRWFFGSFADMLATPVLVWIILLSMGYGMLRRCGLLSYRATFRERRARTMTLLLLVIYVGVILLLTVAPHAILLSATGQLWPSPFSRALVPVIAFSVISLCAFYGIIAGYLDTLSDVYDAALYGIRLAAPLLLFYLLLAQLYLSFWYSLGQVLI